MLAIAPNGCFDAIIWVRLHCIGIGGGTSKTCTHDEQSIVLLFTKTRKWSIKFFDVEQKSQWSSLVSLIVKTLSSPYGVTYQNDAEQLIYSMVPVLEVIYIARRIMRCFAQVNQVRRKMRVFWARSS